MIFGKAIVIASFMDTVFCHKHVFYIIIMMHAFVGKIKDSFMNAPLYFALILLCLGFNRLTPSQYIPSSLVGSIFNHSNAMLYIYA